MKLDLGKLSYDAQEYDFKDGAKLMIRPYPRSKSNLIVKDKGIALTGEDQCKIFKYCLVSWSDVIDANGKELKLTDDVKQHIFDFGVDGIPEFVLEKAKVFERKKEDEEKNSSAGPDGISTTTE